MARIIKRPRALADIEEHAWFILQDSVEAGLRFAEACDETFERLADMPLMGSPRETKDARLLGLRMWPVEGFPNHLIFYIPQEDGIEVIRVLHGAREMWRILEAEE